MNSEGASGGVGSRSSSSGVPSEDTYLADVSSPLERIQQAFGSGLTKVGLIVSAISGKLATSHPKMVQRQLAQTVAAEEDIIEVKYTSTGRLIIWVSSESSAVALLSLKELNNQPVDVSVLLSSVSVKFLLKNCDPSLSLVDIHSELRDQKFPVIFLRRFVRKSNLSSSQDKLPIVLVTAVGAQPPEFLKLWYVRFPTTAYIPLPRLCKNCFSFGHTQRFCRQIERCSACGKHFCEGGCRVDYPFCINCQGSHSYNDRKCPVFQRECRILQLQQSHRISYPEAKSLLSSKQSYAVAASGEPSSSRHLEQRVTQLSRQVSSLTEQVQQLVSIIGQSFPTVTVSASPEKSDAPMTPIKTGSQDRSSVNTNMTSGEQPLTSFAPSESPWTIAKDTPNKRNKSSAGSKSRSRKK